MEVSMNIYNEDGWLDYRAILSAGVPFNFITGARGTGKTYGGLSKGIDRYQDGKGRFILLRRTMAEAELLWRNEQTNPFYQLNEDKGWNYGVVKKTKYTADIVRRVAGPDGQLVPDGEPVGMVLALSTVANLRGFSAGDVNYIFYDEFIPEPHVRPIRDEHLAFLNMYETINRNRELRGEPPVLVVCASNSNRLDNPLYSGLGLVDLVDRMKQRSQTVSVNRERGVQIVNMERSPISDAKRYTALYRMAGSGAFSDMALDNKYIGEGDRSLIQSRPLREYTPVCNVRDITVYKHKTGSDLYIIHRDAPLGGLPTFLNTSADTVRFRRQYGWIWLWYLQRRIFFDRRSSELVLTSVFK